MKSVELLKDIPLLQVVPHADTVYTVNGLACTEPLVVVNVTQKDDVTIVELPNMPESGTERRLYSDQHQSVTVERTTISPDDDGALRLDETDWITISDALMLLAERHEREGLPSRQIRAALRTWQYFIINPKAKVEVTITRVPDRLM